MGNVYLGVGGVDIAALSMAMSSMNVANQWSIGVMSQALEQVEQQGQMIADMLAGIPTPGDPPQGSTFSIRI